jgi:AraC-like DNA-binding protein
MLSISENILLFISGFGFLQAFLSAGLLYFHPRSDKSVGTFLALYIVLVPSPMLIPLLQSFFPWQVFIFVAPFTLAIGPSLYLYVRSYKEVITWRKAWPHFILFFVYLLIILWLSSTTGSKYPPTKHMPAEVLHDPLTIIPISIRMIQMLTYYFLSRRVLTSYQQSILHLFSETSKINLNWVRLLINGYLILVISTITLYSLVLRYSEYFNLFVLINAAIITPYIYMATLKGITQPTLWQIQPGSNKEKMEQEMQKAEEIEKQKASDEKLTPTKTASGQARIAEIVVKITRLMEQDKLYQETQLTLQNLADKLLLPSYQVSQAINDGLNKTFYDLINSYRVEEAKRLLLDERNRNYTILSVGFEAGFNSKTTFNTVFKKFTGFTPTEFRRERQAEAVIRG